MSHPIAFLTQHHPQVPAVLWRRGARPSNLYTVRKELESIRMHFDKRLAVFSAIFICASASQFLEQEWTMWKSKYGKSYTTKTVESFRKTAWEATWEKVEKHNQLAAQGLKNYTLEMNHFADKTPEERKSHSCFRSSWKFKPPGPSKIYSRKPAQATNNVDWRKTKCVTHIKNQGGLCGSCWAFAAVGVLESRYCLKKGKRVVLSEQQLVDCDSSNDGCCGGFPIAAFVYITQNGIMRNKHYEYLEKNSECKFDEDKAIILNVTKYYSLPDEENMASDVAINGPITVGIGASDDLTLYKEGIYDGDCEELNHAIIIVGYGSEPSKDDPENTEDYWIIRNSWGKEWGDGGYGKMKRNVNQCGIGEEAAALDLTFV